MKQVDITTRTIPNRPRNDSYPIGSTVAIGAGGGNSTIINNGGGIDLAEARRHFLSKTSADTASGIIAFLQGLRLGSDLVDKLSKENTEGELTDTSVMSALRVLKEIANNNDELKKIFLRKDQEDTTNFLINLMGGVIAPFIQSPGFVSGPMGAGFTLKQNADGKTYAEVDKLMVRMKAIFQSLEIMKTELAGASFMFNASGARMTIVRTERFDHQPAEFADGSEAVFADGSRAVFAGDGDFDPFIRCWFVADDGETAIENRFRVGNLVRSQTFNIKAGVHEGVSNRFWWREVVGVGDDYIDIAIARCAEGSDLPAEGDVCVQLGDLNDIDYQSAIIISAYGTDAPSIKYYQGIDSYSLVDREIKADYYDPTTGRFKSITYGDTYIGAKDKSTFVSYDQEEGVNIKGKVSIQSGSSGVGNFEDLPDEIQKAVQIGAGNLLLNTSFAGDYEPLSLDSETKLSGTTDLYSPKLIGWGGSANVVEDANFISGFGASLGNITQKIRLINGENYVVSYKAKGTSVKVIIGGITIEQKLTSQYTKYKHVFTDNGWLLIEFTGNCVIGEIKLERGTIATDWCPSVKDPSKDKEGFKHLFDIQAALKGQTQFYGGLGLTTMIQLGVWENDVLTKINAGISGIWNNDTDVAFWAGGTYEEAIATVQRIINGETPTDEEWKSLAKFVVTHGGDVFIRGYIYAMGGYFRGLIDLGNGNIRLNADGTGWIGVNEEGEKFIEIEKNSVNFNGRIHAGAGSSIGNLQISENGSLYGYSSTIEQAMYSAGLIDESYINNFIKNNIDISSIFFLVFQNVTTGTHTIYLPNSTNLFAKKQEVLNGILTITLFVPRVWSFAGINIDNNATFEIRAESGTAIYDNNGNEIDKISLAKGDILELMSCLVTKQLPGSSTLVGTVEVEYYIKSLRQ